MSNVAKLLPTLADDIVRLSFRHVFFASIIMQMKRVAVRSGTAAIDGRTLWINPEFYNPLPVAERVSLLAHEADHVARLHPTRGVGLDPYHANIAMDQVINRDLRAMKYPLPADGVHLDDSLDLTMEQWYEMLVRKGAPKPQKKKKGDKGAPQSGGEDGQPQSGDGDGQPQSGGQPEKKAGKPDGKSGGKGQGKEEPQSGDEDVPTEGTDSLPDMPQNPMRAEQGSGWGDVVEPQPDGEQSPVTEAEIRQLVSSALSVSRGTLPADYAQTIAETLQPVEDWRALLADFLTSQLTREDRSFRRENTRYSGGLIMPVMHSEAHGTIAVCMDSSGSVDEQRLGQFLAEIDSLRRELRATVYHSHCDTRHSGWETVQVDDDLPREVKNRGGTDFAPIMEALVGADWDGEAPSCAVVFTDGECDSYGGDPSIPVLWMHAPRNPQRMFTPPFGRVVNMKSYN